MRKPVGVALFLSASMIGAVALAEPDKPESETQVASSPAGAAERGLARPVAHGTTNVSAAAPTRDEDCDGDSHEAAKIKPTACAHAINTKGTGMAGRAAGAPPTCPGAETRGTAVPVSTQGAPGSRAAADGGFLPASAPSGPVVISTRDRTAAPAGEGASSAPATGTETCPPAPSNGAIKKSKSNISTN
jgi:hypothetical protein